jgi:hypothetical protein
MTTLKNILAVAASLVIFTNSTHAQTVKSTFSETNAVPMQVKYLGDEGDYLRFEVTMQTENPSKAVFAIEDRNEGELYSSILRTPFKVQTFKIEKGVYQSLNFKLINGKNSYTRSFSVIRSLVETTTVSECDITKL